MQISKRVILVPAVLTLLALGVGAAVPAERTAVSAYNSARGALMRSDFATALPDLKFAADRGVFIAQYYLARLYAMHGQPFTDHAKAFALFGKLVAAHRVVDPFLDYRAPFVAKSEVLLALYYLSGLPSAGVAPDPARAKSHLEHAALRLGDTDAQYELGRLDLNNPDTIPRGLDALDMLAQTKHHAAAAAQIALVYSQGRYSEKVLFQALAYASLSVKLANDADRFWINDIFQSIYCQTSAADRERAKAFAIELEHGNSNATDGDAQPPSIGSTVPNVQGILDLTDAGATRACSNGDIVPDSLTSDSGELAAPPKPMREAADGAAKHGFNSVVGYIGPAMGIGLKDLESPQSMNEDAEPEAQEPGAPTN